MPIWSLGRHPPSRIGMDTTWAYGLESVPPGYGSDVRLLRWIDQPTCPGCGASMTFIVSARFISDAIFSGVTLAPSSCRNASVNGMKAMPQKSSGSGPATDQVSHGQMLLVSGLCTPIVVVEMNGHRGGNFHMPRECGNEVEGLIPEWITCVLQSSCEGCKYFEPAKVQLTYLIPSA